MKKALIVDDSRSIREALRGILEDAGFATAEAVDGADALKQLASKGPFQLALVDWYMPIMDGLAFVKQARAQPQYADMVIMMVTSESDSDRIYEALDAGAQTYVLKPFSPDTVLDVLEDAGFKVS